MRNAVWGVIAGLWAAFLLSAGVLLFSLFLPELRADLAALQVREIVATQVGLFVTGVVVGICRPLLRRAGGAYILGGLTAVAFFGTQLTVAGAFAEGGGPFPLLVVMTFAVGAAMTPLFRYGLERGHLPFAWIDRFLAEVWHTPPDPKSKDAGGQDGSP